MNKFPAIALISLLSACSTLSPNKTVDTREWVNVDCSGAAGWEACYKKAESRCPNGFDIASKEENLVTGLRSFAYACRSK